MTAPKRADVEGAADVLRQLLAKVDSGELEAKARRGAAVVARLESALLGLECAAGAVAAAPNRTTSSSPPQVPPTS